MGGSYTVVGKALAQLNTHVAGGTKQKYWRAFSTEGAVPGLQHLTDRQNADSNIRMIIGILFAIFSVKMIVGSMKKVIVQVSQGAQHTLTVAGQVSAASQSLASGSSEQAASIEETSASLEEMTAGTQKNAAHAQESAGASEELNAQAGRMKSTIDELAGLIGDTGSHETGEEITSSIANDDIQPDVAFPEPVEDETPSR